MPNLRKMQTVAQDILVKSMNYSELLLIIKFTKRKKSDFRVFPGPEVKKRFACSTQLSTQFQLL